MNRVTKDALRITEMYKNSSDTELYHVYGTCSRKKLEAFDDCRKLMADYDGRDLRILSHNSHVFTAGFEYMNPETGEVMIMYITKSGHRPVFWTEEDMLA